MNRDARSHCILNGCRRAEAYAVVTGGPRLLELYAQRGARDASTVRREFHLEHLEEPKIVFEIFYYALFCFR